LVLLWEDADKLIVDIKNSLKETSGSLLGYFVGDSISELVPHTAIILP
jgi:hypothetical protein